MALRSDYRVTDDDGHIEDVTVTLDWESSGNPVINISQPGEDIQITFGMANDIIDALQRLMRDAE
jgi:hypothetical protein